MKTNTLKWARFKIDVIDFLRTALLALRYTIVLDVIKFKKENKLHVVDGDREARQVKKASKLANLFHTPTWLAVGDITNTIALITKAEKIALKEPNPLAGSVIEGFCTVHNWRTSAVIPDNGDEPRCSVCHSPLKIL